MLSNLKQKYAALRPEQQQRATIAMIVGGLVVFGCLAYFLSGGSSKPKTVDVSVGVPQGKTVLNFDGKILEKSMTQQQAQDAQQLADLKKKVAMLEGGGTAANAPVLPTGQVVNPLAPGTGQVPGQPNQGVQQLDQIIQQRNNQASAPVSGPAPAAPATTKKARPLPAIPPPAPTAPMASMPSGFTVPPPASASSSAPYYQAPSAERKRAGIGQAVNEGAKDAVKVGTSKVDDSGKKKDKTDRPSVYLPPSFMEATTLSGLNAPTSDAGRSNPMPVFMRIAAPAILPNEVKANLKGCFVIGEAVGSLSDHRAHVRLVSIACLSKNGQAVIDQDIVGFVQDADGNIGLAGNVVSKMGSAVARLAAVGLLKGLGDAMSTTATTSNNTVLGQINSIGTTARDIGFAATGGAIANSAKGIAKIYEDLALGSLPVVEVGNHKKITLMITKGVQLEIKNFKTVPWR